MNFIFILIGFTAGILAGFFGIGGGIIIVPALMLLCKFEPHQAVATSLTALVFPVGLLGVIEYYQNDLVSWKGALLLALGLFLGAYIGAWFGLKATPSVLKRAFAVFLLCMSVHLWRAA